MTTAKVILDSNLAILLVAGMTSAKYIQKHKRLRKYDEEAFQILNELIGIYSGIIFTPNVLTETSNLIRYIDDPIRTELATTLRLLISKTEEVFVASVDAASRREYLRLGITDSVLLTLASSDSSLLTDDLDLFLAAEREGFRCSNFSRVREEMSNL